MSAAAAIHLCEVGKTYPGRELSLRGTKLETQGPVLWVRNAARAVRLTGEAAPPVRALERVSLTVAPGEVLGVLGPNGSGKTTLIKILAGLIRPSEGVGTVAGWPLSQAGVIRRHVAYVSTTGWMGLEWALTAEENLRFFAELSGMPSRRARERTRAALAALDLTADAAKLSGELSNGMRQRLLMARALLWHTPVVLLDEPFVGLDPDHRRQVRDLIRGLPREGQTVVVSDHQADVIEAVADRVLVLEAGRVQAMGTPRELVRPLAGLSVLEVVTEMAATPAAPPPPIVHHVEWQARPGPMGRMAWRLTVETGDTAFSAVLAWLDTAGGRIIEVEERRPGLRDVLPEASAHRVESA